MPFKDELPKCQLQNDHNCMRELRLTTGSTDHGLSSLSDLGRLTMTKAPRSMGSLLTSCALQFAGCGQVLLVGWSGQLHHFPSTGANLGSVPCFGQKCLASAAFGSHPCSSAWAGSCFGICKGYHLGEAAAPGCCCLRHAEDVHSRTPRCRAIRQDWHLDG